jgi:hypothetical protein
MTECQPNVKEDGFPSQVFSWWSLAILVTITCLVTWIGIERYMDPVGEKYVHVFPPGNMDFFFPFGGARALLMGENPYLNNIPGLDDPWNRGFGIINGKQYRGLYPPTHFIIYLPLAMITDDWREAGRILFPINIAALFLLSIITWWLVARIGNLTGVERQASLLLIPLCFFILTTNAGTSLGLERGDGGDILAAALCWSAIALFLKEWRFLAMFLMVPAMFIKGYPIWCGLGIGLLGLERRTWAPVVAGAVAGVMVFLAPVIRYLPDFFALFDALALSYPNASWKLLWWNHGFWNVFFRISPGLADAGRGAMVAWCVVLSLACWIKARRAMRQGPSSEATLWIVLFATCSIESMLGFSMTSIVYNLVLVMPGMLIIFVLGDMLVRACGLPKWTVHMLGALNLSAAFLVYKFRLFDWAGFPSAGIGMILFLLTIGMAMSCCWWLVRRSGTSQPSSQLPS